MTVAAKMPSVADGGLSVGPDPSLVKQSRQALARIESDLCQKLKVIASLSTPEGMDNVQWQSTREAMEAQAKRDAENEKLPYKAVTELSELHQIYEGLMVEAKNLLATAEDNTLERTCEFDEAKKKIEALLRQASHKNVSLKLDLGGLLLHSVPDAIQKLSSTLVKLDLSNNTLDSLPESVTCLVNLIHLDVHSNKLTSLPDSIGRLVKLKVFNVSRNNIAALPDCIQSCRALEELIADSNGLTRLPETLGFELLNLRKLSVHSNKIMRLPYSTSHMMSLRFLDVHMNRLRSLPEDLKNLISLEYLNLGSNFNYIVALPESIGSLTSLIELNISYNHITALPDSIGCLQKLQRLKVEGNPLVVPPAQVVDQGVDAIKKYMADRLKARSGEHKHTMKDGRQSWLRQIVPKWMKCSSDVANAFAWQEYRPEDSEDEGAYSNSFATPPPRRRDFFSPLRNFTPRHSSSPLRAFLTPRRTPHHVYFPRHI